MSRRGKNNQSRQQNPLARAGPEQTQVHVSETRASVRFQGPLPPPQVLAQYEDAVPGLGERIVVLLEKQTEHRISIEKQVISSDISRSKWGLVAGLLVALAAMGVAYFLVATGHSVEGAGLGGVDLVSLASVFVIGTNSRRAEREEKQRRLLGLDEDEDEDD